ncbi:hypothetical protein E2562_035662 [Oryza meyeriana var. granulata]|uniref:Uncharacterized protein n=1 Tax=Oryza meyeriana var. granulata TaxID=110450 RepID=A0A6G1E7B4_9ORYZ|nr:hypothetical protein E2562_035662 [Oryza meyeriana var. granulata]
MLSYGFRTVLRECCLPACGLGERGSKRNGVGGERRTCQAANGANLALASSSAVTPSRSTIVGHFYAVKLAQALPHRAVELLRAAQPSRSSAGELVRTAELQSVQPSLSPSPERGETATAMASKIVGCTASI